MGNPRFFSIIQFPQFFFRNRQESRQKSPYSLFFKYFLQIICLKARKSKSAFIILLDHTYVLGPNLAQIWIYVLHVKKTWQLDFSLNIEQIFSLLVVFFNCYICQTFVTVPKFKSFHTSFLYLNSSIKEIELKFEIDNT